MLFSLLIVPILSGITLANKNSVYAKNIYYAAQHAENLLSITEKFVKDNDFREEVNDVEAKIFLEGYHDMDIYNVTEFSHHISIKLIESLIRDEHTITKEHNFTNLYINAIDENRDVDVNYDYILASYNDHDYSYILTISIKDASGYEIERISRYCFL
jgi:hypothetical protein